MTMFPEIPGYKIEKKIGESSMTEVYLGVQEDLERNVAIKVLNPVLFQDKTLAERFMKEAREATKFVHPNIADIPEVGETNDLHYIVMEYLPESLRDKIISQFKNGGGSDQMEIERGAADFTMEAEPKTGEKLEVPELLHILKQVIRALDYAHKNGVFHTNIRPENIRFREDGTPTVVDFFISKVLGPGAREALKEKGITYGSPYYGSPEQALKKPLDGKSDIYSLGVVFYEMLTGQVPYNAAEEMAIENQHIMEPVPQLPDHLRNFQPLLDKMMAKDKEKRTPGGTELVQLIDGVTHKVPEDRVKERREPEIAAEQDIPLEKQVEILERQAKEAERETKTEKRNITLKLKSSGKGKEDFLKTLLNPKILVPVVGVLVIIVVLGVLVGLFNKPSTPTYTGDTGKKVQGQQEKVTVAEKQKPLTKEERLEQERKERQFQYQFQLAKKFFKSGQYQKALEKLKKAETFKTTPESKQLAEKIKVKQLEKKDHDAFKNALAAASISAVEEYLQQFPSGLHVKEAQEKLKELQEENRRQEAERRRILAASTRLRSQPRDLSVQDVRAMLEKHGFFEKYYHKSGDFKNHFEVRDVKKDKIVVDFATALIWHQSGSESYMNVEKARQWIADLNQQGYGGYSDWRLPTLEEAASLIEKKESMSNLFIDPVFSSEQRYIWTADTFEKTRTWAVDFYSGDVSKVPLQALAYVRPVRSLR
ncbi:MAG: protein kinase [Candidatus Aminicenantes bacterium]|nr:MAG: protein kinase [Candidatus Aminicenantes bacterium]